MILYDVRKNKIESFIIISIFITVITVGLYFVSYTFFDLGYYSIVIALMFSLLSAFISYFSCDKIVLSLNNARKATEEQDKLVSSILDNLCIAAGLPRPSLYVIEDNSMNAFATGRNPQNAVICVTTGLLENMNKYELEGVLAHELSHIKNYDILLATVVSVFVGLVVILADLFTRVSFRRSSDDNSKSNGIMAILAIIFIILSPIFSTLMQLAISRKREYLADASAIEITRNKEGLISALKKLSMDTNDLENINKSTAHLFISNPMKEKRAKTDLFSTHPPIEERIRRLELIK